MGYRLLGSVIFAALWGLGSAYAIWTSDGAPKWMIAFSGLLALIGVAATVVLLAFVYVTIIESLRVRLVARRPKMPLALTTELGALIGTRRFNQHPVRFWSGLIVNEAFFIGFMTLAKAKEETFAVEAPTTFQQENEGE